MAVVASIVDAHMHAATPSWNSQLSSFFLCVCVYLLLVCRCQLTLENQWRPVWVARYSTVAARVLLSCCCCCCCYCRCCCCCCRCCRCCRCCCCRCCVRVCFLGFVFVLSLWLPRFVPSVSLVVRAGVYPLPICFLFVVFGAICRDYDSHAHACARALTHALTCACAGRALPAARRSAFTRARPRMTKS